MIDNKFVEELTAKYQKTNDGKWYVDMKYGLGEMHCAVLTDNRTFFNGQLIASFGDDFGQWNADFCVFCHENIHRIIELYNELNDLQQLKK